MLRLFNGIFANNSHSDVHWPKIQKWLMTSGKKTFQHAVTCTKYVFGRSFNPQIRHGFYVTIF